MKCIFCDAKNGKKGRLAFAAKKYGICKCCLATLKIAMNIREEEF